MTTLHTFGCSITQGFALPDTINPVLDDQGRPLDSSQVQDMIERKIVKWEDIHLYKPSDYAWPAVLADRLGIAVKNYARRGACFQQISRQCAVAARDIQPDDIVIVMWTYLSRLSVQWPARTTVPFCNIVDPFCGWQTKILPGFNKFFGLSAAPKNTSVTDDRIHQYIQDSAKYTYLNPLGIYNQYYNNLVLQQMTAGFLNATGARVIHLSVEHELPLRQLEKARQNLDDSLRSPYVIPHPDQWYTVSVDHTSCLVIHDTSIPPAENDMHPSVQHHSNFALHIYKRYFQNHIQ